jgi:Anti-sigma-K factor rskA
MDHDEVLEQLELAAVEPDGLARLVAGDTASAAAVAGHLAGCDSCSGEFQRLGRAAPLLREVVRTTPPGDLRERTLAYVREHGEPRGVAASAAASEIATRPAAAPPTAAATTPAPASFADAGPRRRANLLPWVASLAAAIALALAATSFLAYQQASQRLADQEHAVADLVAVTSATLEISAQPDVERVALTATSSDTSGSLLFSPASTRLVVVATGLQRPPAGQEYRCWVDRAGTRENVGRMFFAGDLAYWVGKVPAISDVAPGTTFGVSLADLQGILVDGPPVIAGEL